MTAGDEYSSMEEWLLLVRETSCPASLEADSAEEVLRGLVRPRYAGQERSHAETASAERMADPDCEAVTHA